MWIWSYLLQAKKSMVKNVVDFVNQRTWYGKKGEYSCTFLFSKENEFFEAKIIFNLLVASESNNRGIGLWAQAINLNLFSTQPGK